HKGELEYGRFCLQRPNYHRVFAKSRPGARGGWPPFKNQAGIPLLYVNEILISVGAVTEYASQATTIRTTDCSSRVTRARWLSIRPPRGRANVARSADAFRRMVHCKNNAPSAGTDWRLHGPRPPHKTIRAFRRAAHKELISLRLPPACKHTPAYGPIFLRYYSPQLRRPERLICRIAG